MEILQPLQQTHSSHSLNTFFLVCNYVKILEQGEELKSNFTFLLPDTHCHTRTVKAPPFFMVPDRLPAPQHSTAVEICTGFQHIRLGSCCLTCLWTPNIHTSTRLGSPSLPCGFHWGSFPFPSLLHHNSSTTSIQSSRTIPHGSRLQQGGQEQIPVHTRLQNSHRAL